MISPLLIGIIGGILFISLLWALPIYFKSIKKGHVGDIKIAEKNYHIALEKLAQNPRNQKVVDDCFGLGETFYSLEYPDTESYSEVEYAIINRHVPTPEEVRRALILHDMELAREKKRQKLSA